MSNPSIVLVLMTCADRRQAETIAEALVTDELVACVNIIGPITSVYRWQGKVERNPEFLCIAKTTAGAVEALKAELPRLHSYDVPELLVLPVADGLPAYLSWIVDSVAAGRPS